MPKKCEPLWMRGHSNVRGPNIHVASALLIQDIAFTKALHCLSKYGDDLTIHATDECLTLSTTNSSMSAYCRFKYERQFFSKHRTVEKTVDRCELSIIEGDASEQNNDGEDEDSLESRLTVRLHCKHDSSAMMVPGSPGTDNESHLTIGPRAVKDMLEHFPVARGTKSDPQLVWSFKDTEVEVKSLETSLDSKGQVVVGIRAPQLTFLWQATIAFAESLGLALDIRFTDPANPLFIDVESDLTETLFVISTSQVPGQPFQPSQAQPLSNRSNKREREGDAAEHPNKYKKPMKAAQRDPIPSASATSSTPFRNLDMLVERTRRPALQGPQTVRKARIEIRFSCQLLRSSPWLKKQLSDHQVWA
ncbi:Rad9-domain-containing protein [Salix suchowensis]|nr:Rad9-domain-containing protein [Salix suchowensis]